VSVSADVSRNRSAHVPSTVVGTAHVPWIRIQLVALSATAFVLVLQLTSYKTFYYDEWTFISMRRLWDLELLFEPQNQYLSTIPILVWKLLFSTVGLASYVPYEATLLATHLAAVALLFIYVRRRSGDLPALAAAVTLLFLGAGGENIVFAFQICWVGAFAFGLLALILLDGDPPFPRRVPAISLALLASVMCHTIGLAFFAAIFLEVVADPGRRRWLVCLVAPIGAYIGWLFAFDNGSSRSVFGSVAQGVNGIDYVVRVTGFVLTGVGASAAGILSLPTGAWPACLVAVATLLGWLAERQGRIERWQLGMIGGILGLFGVAAVGRAAEFGPLYSNQSRYVYVGTVFLLPLAAHAARELPWHGLWSPALGTVFAVALMSNVIQLHAMALSQVDYMRNLIAELRTAEVFRDAPDLAGDRYIDNNVTVPIRAKEYLAATRELGSPVPPANLDTLKNLPTKAVDSVLVNLFGDAVTLKTDSSRSIQGMSCREVDSTAGSTIDWNAPNGESLVIQSSEGGNVKLFLGFAAPPKSDSILSGYLPAGDAAWIHVPDTGKPVVWRLRIKTGAAGMVRVCGSN
jgi:hypothetical protein